MELDLSGLQVYGECQASLFQQVTETIRSGTFEVIFVEGEGGSGKTTLFQACCEYLDTKNHEFPIVYARDKWEEHFYCHSTHAASFWRILNCLRQVLVKLESIEPPLESEGSERSFQTQLRAEFAAELNILSTIVPLKVKSQPNDDLAPLALSTDRTGGLDRVRLAVRDLLRFITLHAKVVWFLDDLQWVDESSLQLIQTILFDKELSNFVLVGTHRPLYSDSGSLSECPIDQVPHLIDRLKTAIRVADPSSECARATLLRVRNLEMLDVTHLLCDLFQRPRDEIDAMQPLAAAVHKKTNGNAFFVIQFVQLLVTLSLIKFSFVEYRWVWDLQAIYAETDVSENVVQIVTAKLRAMTAELRHVLSTAAFLGMNQIQFDLLQYILASSKIVTENDDLQNITAGLSNENNEATGTVVRFNADMLERLLQQGVAEGILEKLDHSDREYKFAHDRIKESALLLLPPDKVTQRRLHLHVSKRLRKRLLKMTKSPKDSIDTRSMERKDTLLLLTVSHINAGSEQIQKPADRLVAASLNLEAGRLAAENASYYIARDFLSAGLKFLDISKGWNEYYDIKLELTTALARAHFCCGDFEKSRIYGERVVKNARSLEDKLLAYRSLVYYYIHNARLSVALDVVLNVLSKVGLEIPTRFQGKHLALCATFRNAYN
jgi:predicted ATPase